MSKMPTISITKVLPNETIAKNYDDDESDLQDAITDIEDLDSNDDIAECKNMIKILHRTCNNNSPNVTDIEEYSDSCSDDDKNHILLETNISLTNFFDHDYTAEEIHIADKIASRTNKKIIEGNFISTIFNNDTDCITRIENVDDTEINEQIKDEIDNSIPDFLNHPVTIVDRTCETNAIDSINLNMIKDIDDQLSDIEDFILSENDSEIVDFEISDEQDTETEGARGITYPKIDITLITEGLQCSNRSITMSYSEPVTDIEKLDSSNDDEDDDDEISNYLDIPRARVSITSLTDIEDLEIGDMCEILPEVKNVDSNEIPPPIREIIIVKEDESGDPVTSVMPLLDTFHLGIKTYNFDSGLTDTEEISGIEDDVVDNNIPIIDLEMPDAENAIVENSEKLITSNQIKRNEIIDIEPITDTEEIFLAGTVRRKKFKSKNHNKQNRKYLDVKSCIEPVKTDIEDLEISDFEQTEHGKSKEKEYNQQESTDRNLQDMLTDIETISGEESDCEGEISDGEIKSNLNSLIEERFFSTITSIESICNNGEEIKRKPRIPIFKMINFKESELCSQNPTDIEDIQLQSDVEDNNSIYDLTPETITPHELQVIFNENSVSVIHEKTARVFNIDEEKYHIKGMKDCTETHTDIEYLDDDVVVIPSKAKNQGNLYVRVSMNNSYDQCNCIEINYV